MTTDGDGAPERPRRRMRLGSFRKEGTLLFLAFFYFLIATNTQTGWLFLMSAFMFGVLALAWVVPRRHIRGLEVRRSVLGSLQKGVATAVRLELHNHTADGAAREIRVEHPAEPWSRERAPFRWVVARLPGSASRSVEFSITPESRGEHRLAGTRLVCGAPFGLFPASTESEPGEPFLVYPKLESLPLHRRRSRLAGVLAEFSSPKRKGDSRTLRSLREYQPGDDLRSVHWRSSAKSPASNLLVREHQAPSRQLSLILLDTSRCQGPGEGGQDLGFEKAVSLTASMLWSAHRAGTRSCLVLLDGEGEWALLKRWPEQYTALARVGYQNDLGFEEWQTGARAVLEGNPLTRGSRTGPVVVKALSPATRPEGPWPDWPAALLVCVDPLENPSTWEGPSHLHAVDARRPGLVEVTAHV